MSDTTVTVENDVIHVVTVGVQGPSGGQPVPRFPYVDFINDADPQMSDVGRTAWSVEHGTLQTLLSTDGVILQIGQETHLRAKNGEASQINNGQVVFVNGAQGQLPKVYLASASSYEQSSKCIAMATQDVAAGATGYFTLIGTVNGIPTGDFEEGDTLYLSETAGEVTNTVPAYPANRVRVGVCTYSNPAVGKISFGVNYELRKFGDPEGGDYTGFNDHGFMVQNGDARTYRDEKTDALILRQQGPGVSTNVSEGTVELASSADLNDYLFTNVQLNHDRDLSETVTPHVHFFQTSASVPNLLMEYRWQINGGSKTTAWTRIKCNTLVHAYTSGTLNQIATAGPVTPPAGTDISDIVQLRVYRDNANASGLFAGVDTFAGPVGILSADIHIRLNSTGSLTQGEKGV